jgi:hypothetical protein
MSMFPVLFFVVVIVVVGSFLFKIFKHGGFKAAMFGAPIEHTFGEVKGSGVKLMSTVVKIHTLGGGDHEKAIGLELVAKSAVSYQMMPVSLSASEARKLIVLLQSAVAASDPSR